MVWANCTMTGAWEVLYLKHFCVVMFQWSKTEDTKSNIIFSQKSFTLSSNYHCHIAIQHLQDLVGASLIIPLIIIQVRSLGVSHVVGGAISSIYGVLQVITSPIVVGTWDYLYSTEFGEPIPCKTFSKCLSPHSYSIVNISVLLRIFLYIDFPFNQ